MNLADYSSQRTYFQKSVVIYQRLAPATCFLAAQKVFWMSCMFLLYVLPRK